MRRIPEVLRSHLEKVGVDIKCNTRVCRVRTVDRRVTGVEIEHGEVIPCDAVISNYHGVGTYDELVEDCPPAVRRRLNALPLQSPGICAYVSGRGRAPEFCLSARCSTQEER
jgi:phytoene dehydrogenase-like protein